MSELVGVHTVVPCCFVCCLCMLLVYAAVHVVPPLLHQARQVHQRRHQPCCDITYRSGTQLLLSRADAQAAEAS